MHRALAKYKNFRPFTEPEAWVLFKIAAIAEAIGWSLLITGIILRSLMHGNQTPVVVAGRIHGTLFISYIIAAIACGPSLRWSLPRTVVAGLCSVPPYGSLVYEWISARHRTYANAEQFRRVTSYQLLNSNQAIGR